LALNQKNFSVLWAAVAARKLIPHDLRRGFVANFPLTEKLTFIALHDK
jgi:hypothetical protein